MYLVGLTGGIGSGKSTVAGRLEEHGCEVIDADRVAREVVQPGEAALTDLVERFGPSILQPDGQLDRQALAAIAFGDDDARADLDRITHPRVAARIAARIAELGAAADASAERIVVVDHPLLVETGQARRFDDVVVVLAPEELRVARLVAARDLTGDEARARMRAQADDAARRAVATRVIENVGSLEELRQRTDEVYAELVVAAASADERAASDRR